MRDPWNSRITNLASIITFHASRIISLERHLNAAEHNKEVFVPGLRRSSRIFESFEAQVKHIPHEAIQIPVRTKEKGLSSIRLRGTVGDLKIRITELQLPRSEARLAVSIAKQIVLHRDTRCIWLIFAGEHVCHLRRIPFRHNAGKVSAASAQIVATLVGLIVLGAQRCGSEQPRYLAVGADVFSVNRVRSKEGEASALGHTANACAAQRSALSECATKAQSFAYKVAPVLPGSESQTNRRLRSAVVVL